MKNIDFLVFWVGDGGDSESYSVYYSNIVSAPTKELAIREYVKKQDRLADTDVALDNINYEYYGTIPCDKLKI